MNIRLTSPPSVRAALGVAGVLLAAAAGIGLVHPSALAATATLRAPAVEQDAKPAATGSQTVVLAGGCFWGVQGVFQHVKGVQKAVSGYSGGAASTAEYETVSTGSTGHAESVQITFDPAQISYGKILQIFFSVAMDPTELDYQGPDHGTQYRSEIFTTNPEQERVSHAYIAQLGSAHVFEAPIVTRVEPLKAFYPAEGYHQDYLTLHPQNPYIAYNDMPKVRDLQHVFPENYRDTPTSAGTARPGA